MVLPHVGSFVAEVLSDHAIISVQLRVFAFADAIGGLDSEKGKLNTFQRVTEYGDSEAIMKGFGNTAKHNCNTTYKLCL